MGVIIPAPKIMKSSLYIIDIPPITERLNSTQRGSERTGGGEYLTPRIVGIFYYLGPGAVNQAQHIALQIYNVAVLRAVEVHHSRPVLGIVEEVQIVAALGQMDNVLAMQGVVGHRAAHRLSDAQPIRVVEEGGGGAGLGHLLELAAFLPSVRPGAVIGGIANGVVGNSGAVVSGHLVLPVGIAIGVGDRLENRAQVAGGVGIPLLGQDIAAPVIVVYPGGAAFTTAPYLWAWFCPLIVF